MEFTVTYKTRLAQARDSFQNSSTQNYLSSLQHKGKAIASGEVGIYLSRQVLWGHQQLYFLYLDIDKDPGEEEEIAIATASRKTMQVVSVLQRLHVLDRFRLIAPGGSGYRLVSPILLPPRPY